METERQFKSLGLLSQIVATPSIFYTIVLGLDYYFPILVEIIESLCIYLIDFN